MSKTAAVLRGLVLLPVVLAQQFPLRTTSYEHFGLTTYIVDRYIYVYDISCYKNRDTGNPCDYILGEWRNQTDDSPRECDDCVLGPMEIVSIHVGRSDLSVTTRSIG
ncbi:LysM domain-containing protein [Colletotrichum lupini]|uniref:LysM domain-containing protein n=1 Tax=Colletotrichum lupini TaxID=145971 RepID=A0A9Q8WBR6_9PEZI|nr:LysM domain-containing protein [Colletotrichum lupini]UQC77499.1 LysM domain-containing protein [Colletotrichum lupini]